MQYLLVKMLILCVVGCTVIGCTSSPRFTQSDREVGKSSSELARGGVRGSYDSSVLVIEGTASYYAHDFHGRLTANGETYDMYELTAAHKTFPFNTRIRVHNLDNGKSVMVRINDRGPFVEGRIIDLSYGAARAIDMIESGIAKVRLEILEWGN